MAKSSEAFTAAQAAALSGVDIKVVHNAIDKRIVQPTGRPRRLMMPDVFRLALWCGVGADLATQARRRLLAEAIQYPNANSVEAAESVMVHVAPTRRQVSARLRDLREAEKCVHSDTGIMGGEPVFKGTRVPVRMVARMLEAGADAHELLDGYPSLNARHLELAKIWAVAHPARGRPKTLEEQGFEPISTSRRLPSEAWEASDHSIR